MMRDLSKLNYTGKGTTYKTLRGWLPEGYRVLNKKQSRKYQHAKRKLNVRETPWLDKVTDTMSYRPIAVQLHRQERILNRVQNLEFETLMKRAGYQYKR